MKLKREHVASTEYKISLCDYPPTLKVDLLPDTPIVSNIGLQLAVVFVVVAFQ